MSGFASVVSQSPPHTDGFADPPNDSPDSPSYHFWTMLYKNGNLMAGMRNSGWFNPNESNKLYSSSIAPNDPNADPGRPAVGGYKYDNTILGEDGGRY